jgi:hypothetical protein
VYDRFVESPPIGDGSTSTGANSLASDHWDHSRRLRMAAAKKAKKAAKPAAKKPAKAAKKKK